MDINNPMGYRRGAEELSQSIGGRWDSGLRSPREREDRSPQGAQEKTKALWIIQFNNRQRLDYPHEEA